MENLGSLRTPLVNFFREMVESIGCARTPLVYIIWGGWLIRRPKSRTVRTTNLSTYIRMYKEWIRKYSTPLEMSAYGKSPRKPYVRTVPVRYRTLVFIWVKMIMVQNEWWVFRYRTVPRNCISTYVRTLEEYQITLCSKTCPNNMEYYVSCRMQVRKNERIIH